MEASQAFRVESEHSSSTRIIEDKIDLWPDSMRCDSVQQGVIRNKIHPSKEVKKKTLIVGWQSGPSPVLLNYSPDHQFFTASLSRLFQH